MPPTIPQKTSDKEIAGTSKQQQTSTETKQKQQTSKKDGGKKKAQKSPKDGDDRKKPKKKYVGIPRNPLEEMILKLIKKSKAKIREYANRSKYEKIAAAEMLEKKVTFGSEKSAIFYHPPRKHRLPVGVPFELRDIALWEKTAAEAIPREKDSEIKKEVAEEGEVREGEEGDEEEEGEEEEEEEGEGVEGEGAVAEIAAEVAQQEVTPTEEGEFPGTPVSLETIWDFVESYGKINDDQVYKVTLDDRSVSSGRVYTKRSLLERDTDSDISDKFEELSDVEAEEAKEPQFINVQYPLLL